MRLTYCTGQGVTPSGEYSPVIFCSLGNKDTFQVEDALDIGVSSTIDACFRNVTVRVCDAAEGVEHNANDVHVNGGARGCPEGPSLSKARSRECPTIWQPAHNSHVTILLFLFSSRRVWVPYFC